MKESFATRFTIDGEFIERQAATKILGVWIGENPSCWERNTQEIKKRTYASMAMLTKLKYAGLSRRKLLHIFSLFIRSYTEYCSVAWHDSLTKEQTNAIERLQIVALKIILGADCPRKPDGHFDYPKALVMCNLKSLFDRRESRTLTFGKKSICHPSLKRLFPLNEAPIEDQPNLRHHEPFHVNFARTATYHNSAIPSIQRRLNRHFL
jgi:hypothetical protein